LQAPRVGGRKRKGRGCTKKGRTNPPINITPPIGRPLWKSTNSVNITLQQGVKLTKNSSDRKNSKKNNPTERKVVPRGYRCKGVVPVSPQNAVGGYCFDKKAKGKRKGGGTPGPIWKS